MFILQSDVIKTDIPSDNYSMVKNEEGKVDDVNSDEKSSVIKNWSSLINGDLEKLIPEEYDCVSTTKEKEPDESEVKLELEGTTMILYEFVIVFHVNLMFSVTLTPKMDAVNSTSNQSSSNNSVENVNINVIQELPKTVSPPVIVRMPSVIQPNVVQPIVTEPDVIEPNIIEPNVIQPKVNQPNGCLPNISQSNVIQHNVTQSSVIQPFVITSSNSSPLPSIASLPMSPLLQSPLNSSIPNDYSFINTLSNISSTPSDRSVNNHTYVSSIKSQVIIK